MTHIRSRITFLFVCLLIVVLAANLHARPKNQDVTKGMKIEDALRVVKRCVVEATSFRDPRASNQRHKELRAQDTLEYVGVTDAIRLNALRRFLVRNDQIGVPSVSGTRGTRSDHYLLPVSALAGLKKSMTLEELARTIVKDAGLPYLSYGKAAQVVANARAEIKRVYDKPPADRPIWKEMSQSERTSFKNALLGQTKGIGSAGFIDGEGNSRRYSATSVSKRIGSIIDRPDATYRDLVEAIYQDAAI